MISIITWSIILIMVCHSLGTVLFGKRTTRYFVYCYNIWMAIDKLVNATQGGDHNATISARAARFKDRNAAFRVMYVLLEKLDAGHGVKAIEELKEDDSLMLYDQINFSQLKRKTGAK